MKIKFLTIVAVALAFLASCDKHDKIDELVQVGPVAPQVYWELASSTTKAGNDVAFKAQYYTSVPDVNIDTLQVWYNVVRSESYQVTCPLLSTFSYTMSRSVEEEVRVPQYIAGYSHKEEYWNNTLRAYTFTDVFPTSYTLASIAVAEPESFAYTDSVTFVNNFGANFAQEFKDSIFIKMQYADYVKMFGPTGLNLLEDFSAYKDSTYDANSDSWIAHFALDTLTATEYEAKTPARNWRQYATTEGGDVVIEIVPTDLIILFDETTIDELLFNKSKQYYELQFSRAYYIEANLRCIDSNGAIGTALETKIELN